MSVNLENLEVMILCGGKGTRLREVSDLIPKPLVKIGEFPIVFHIMKWYAKFGIKNFILCLGYKKESFIDYFTNLIRNTSDIKIDFKTNKMQCLNPLCLDWSITLVDTGLDSKTATRVKIASKYLSSNSRFMLTYGDGLSDIRIDKLYEDHINSKKCITVSKVHAPSRFGIIDTEDNGTVKIFNEKVYDPQYINGGFMILEKNFISDYIIDNEDVFLEKEPFDRVIANKDMHAFVHNGFWQCMDNIKEYEYLNSIWNSKHCPWRVS